MSGRVASAILAAALCCGFAADLGKAATDDCARPKVRPDPTTPHWLRYACTSDATATGAPFFLAGVGGPEGFLYLPRDRQHEIVRTLIDHGGNGIYFESIRSHGGDGTAEENPFIDYDPANGVSRRVLRRWEAMFRRLDNAGITLYFLLYDDGARPFGCDVPLSPGETEYIETIVSRFQHHRHLVWITQEEFPEACPGTAKSKAIASLIRSLDPDHAVGVHHLNGQPMQFGGDPNIQLYSQQAGNSWASVDFMHDLAGKAGWGNWIYVMSEAEPWHKELLADGDANRTELRQSFWATAMAGGYVLLYDSFETHDPTPAMLGDLDRLRAFMESTNLGALAPNDALRFGGTRWVLANPTQRLYVLYSNQSPQTLGVAGLPAGTYRLDWYDPANGTRIESSTTVAAGDVQFTKPAEIGSEAVVYVRP
jgi:hypothetical protein